MYDYAVRGKTACYFYFIFIIQAGFHRCLNGDPVLHAVHIGLLRFIIYRVIGKQQRIVCPVSVGCDFYRYAIGKLCVFRGGLDFKQSGPGVN